MNSVSPTLALIGLLAAGCVAAEHPRHQQSGTASWYGAENGRMANGTSYNPSSMTCAHRNLPIGSKVKITNTRNQKSVVVQVNDRGPFTGNRIVDLNKAPARELDMLRSGTAPVKLEVVAE